MCQTAGSRRSPSTIYLFGGVSPINAQCRDLLGAITRDFAAKGIDLPVYWGNRNWQPFLADTVRQMADDGIGSVIAFVTAAYSSYSSCRQYLDDIDLARAAVGAAAPAIVKIPPYYWHPGFAGSFVTSASAALASLPAEVRDGAELIFTAHSIPESMAAASGPGGGAVPGSADRGGRPGGRRGRPGNLAAGLSEPQRAAVGALAWPGHQRVPDEPGQGRRAGGRRGADRVRQRPHGGHLRPGRRGGADGPRARAADGQGGHARHRSRVRRDDLQPCRWLRRGGPRA